MLYCLCELIEWERMVFSFTPATIAFTKVCKFSSELVFLCGFSPPLAPSFAPGVGIAPVCEDKNAFAVVGRSDVGRSNS